MYNIYLAWLHKVMNHIIPCPSQAWNCRDGIEHDSITENISLHVVTNVNLSQWQTLPASLALLCITSQCQWMADGWDANMIYWNTISCACVTCHMSPHQKVRSWNGLSDDGVCMFSVKSMFILLVLKRHWTDAKYLLLINQNQFPC